MASTDNQHQPNTNNNSPAEAETFKNIPDSKTIATKKLKTLSRPRSQSVSSGALPSAIKTKIRAFSTMLDSSQLEITAPTDSEEKPASELPKAKPKSKVPKVRIAVAIAGLVLIAGVYRYMSVLHLSTYSRDGFSISAPKGYKVEASDRLVSLIPPKSEDYKIIVLPPEQQGLNIDFAQTSSGSQQALLSLAEKSLLYIAQQYLPEGKQLASTTVTLTTHQGKQAVKLTGEIQQNGQKTGQLSAMAVFYEQGVYTIIVMTDAKNPKIQSAADDLAQSFKVL